MIGMPVLLEAPQVGPCQPPCPPRKEAMNAGTFVWNAGLKAYVDTTMPTRERRFEVGPDRRPFKIESPFALVDCPWCGGTMEKPDA